MLRTLSAYILALARKQDACSMSKYVFHAVFCQDVLTQRSKENEAKNGDVLLHFCLKLRQDAVSVTVSVEDALPFVAYASSLFLSLRESPDCEDRSFGRFHSPGLSALLKLESQDCYPLSLMILRERIVIFS